jgi:hypothetical protein
VTVEFIVQVPNVLGQQLQRVRERLPEILERGLREIASETSVAEKSRGFQDENAIMELLTSQPSPEQVLSIRPSPEFQARVSELLRRNKEGELSRQEEVELERYLTLEHMVRLAKAHAYKQMATRHDDPHSN